MRRALCPLALASVLALSGCQPVDPLARPGGLPDSTPVEQAPVGAPVEAVPATFEELRARADEVADEWQDEPRLAEVLVELDPEGRFSRGQLVYLAPHADRFLTVTVDRLGVSQAKPTLATLGLTPLTDSALEALPPAPPRMDPSRLARAVLRELRACGADGRPTGVLYATGAPVAWDGRRWTSTPAWTATVTTGRGGIQADPVTGAPGECLSAS
jgi:hypothetical protein